MGHSNQVKPILVDGIPQNGKKKKKKFLNFRKAFAKFPDKKLSVQITTEHLIPKSFG